MSEKNISMEFKKGYIDSAVSKETLEVRRHIDNLVVSSSSSLSNVSAESNNTKLLLKPTIEEVLFDARADIKVLTSTLSMHLDDAFRKSLFEQVDLIHDPDDWDETDSPINSDAFKSFIRWYILNSPGVKPGYGLSSTGNIISMWFDNKDKLLIEFFPYDKARWLVSKVVDDEFERASGTTKISRLFDVLAPYTPNEFFRQKE